MTIIVTGGAGFIGSNFIFHIRKNARITALSASKVDLAVYAGACHG